MASSNDRSSLRNFLTTTGMTPPLVDYRNSVLYARSYNHRPQPYHPQYPHRLPSSGSYTPVIPNLYTQESYRCCSELAQHQKLIMENFRTASLTNRLTYPSCLSYGSMLSHDGSAVAMNRPLACHSLANSVTALSDSAAKRPRIVRTYLHSPQAIPNSTLMCNNTVHTTVTTTTITTTPTTNNADTNIVHNNHTANYRTSLIPLQMIKENSSNHFPSQLSSPSKLSLNDNKTHHVTKTQTVQLPIESTSSVSKIESSTVNNVKTTPNDSMRVPDSIKTDNKSHASQEQSVDNKPLFKHEPRKRKVNHSSNVSVDSGISSNGSTVSESSSNPTCPVKKPAPATLTSSHETHPVSHIPTSTEASSSSSLQIPKVPDQKTDSDCSVSYSSNPVNQLTLIDRTSTLTTNSFALASSPPCSSKMPFQLARPSTIRPTLTIPRRPILPSPTRKHPNPLLLTSRLILKSMGDTGRIKSILQTRSDLIQATCPNLEEDSSLVLSSGLVGQPNLLKPTKSQDSPVTNVAMTAALTTNITTTTTAATATTTIGTSSSSGGSSNTITSVASKTSTCNHDGSSGNTIMSPQTVKLKLVSETKSSQSPALVSAKFHSTPAEELLWETGFFGKTNPQQLVCTLIYLLAKVLNIRRAYQLRQLRFGPDGQLKVVLSNFESDPKSQYESSSKHPGSDVESSDLNKLMDHMSRFYLFYKPDVELSNNSSEDVDKLGGAYLPNLSNESHHPSGYLVGHFAKNNHERCLVCMHIFYLSKRPSFYANSNSYLLAWLPEPSESLWFRHRTIGYTHLSAIVRTIDATLDYVTRIYSSNMKNLNESGSRDQVIESGKDYMDHDDMDSPLNLVVRECAIEEKQQQQQQQPSKQQEQSQKMTRDRQSTPAHPTCMHYWPELTERARQSPWQCASCKTCTVCENKVHTTDLLICDACDKGYHVECHKPELHEPIDRSLPWVCSGCLDEGYRVAIGTLPSGVYTGLPSSNQESKPADSQNSESNLAQGPDKTTTTTAVSSNSDDKSNSNQSASQDSNSANLSKQSLQGSNSDSATTDKSDSNTESSIGNAQNPLAQTISVPDLAKSNDSIGETESKSNDLTSPAKSISSVVRDDPNTKTGKVDESQDSDPTKQSTPPSSIDPNNNQDDPGLSKSQSSCAESVHSNPTDTVKETHSLPVPRPDDIRIWSVDHVHEWLSGEGFPREADAFLQQEIDGTCLLLMKRMDVLTDLGIKLGPAVKIFERIKRLQSRCASPV